MIVFGLFLILLSVCYSLPQDPTSLPLLDSTDAPKIDIQTQIYIVSGTLGGIILLLILLVLALSISIARIKDQLQGGRQSRYELQHRPAENVSSPRGYGASDHVSSSYVNNAFNGGHEMEERAVDSKTTADRMGYEMYNGRANAENRSSGANNAAPIPRARVQNDNTTSFQNDNRDDYDRRNPNSRYSKQSNHQLRLEEGVSPVRSHDNIDQHDGRQQYQRNRYRE